VLLIGVILSPQLAAAVVINAQSVLSLPRGADSGRHTAAVLERPLRLLAGWTSDGAVERALGHLYLSTGNVPAAIEWYQRDRLGLGAQLSAIALGDAFELLGSRPLALQYWRGGRVTAGYMAAHGLTYAVGGPQLGVAQRLTIASELWPDRSNAWFDVGAAQMSGGAVDESAAAFAMALSVDNWTPQSGSNASPRVADYYLWLVLRAAGRFDEAYSHFSTSLALTEALGLGAHDPSVLALQRFLGLVRMEQGDMAGAASHLRRAVDLGATDDETRGWLAIVEARTQ
jgi:tetratricopeptide (TPR) repeat protein